MSDLPPASEKLRMVLDYVPCEACLSQPVAQQELLCSICHRLDREVGVRIAVTTTVMLDRPTSAAPTLPVVIPPPGVPASAAALPVVEIRYLEPGANPKKAKPGSSAATIDVFVQPIEEEAAPVVAAAPVPLPHTHHVEFEDIASWEAPVDAFEYTGPAQYQAPPPTPVAEPVPVVAAETTPEDDFVFRAPTHEEPIEPVAEADPAPIQEVEEDWMPAEEVPVRTEEDAERWGRPADAAPAEPILEEAPVEPTRVEEDDVPILEGALVEEDEIQETTLVEAPSTEPTGGSTTDLWRLRGFDAESERALGSANIKELAHLSGHDAGELSERTGLDARRLSAWIDVADLKEEVGVPLDAALSLVAAGIAGPRGLRDTDAEDVVAKVDAFAASGAGVQLKDVKRWKRRA